MSSLHHILKADPQGPHGHGVRADVPRPGRGPLKRRDRQRGAVLVVGLVILAVMTLLGVGSMRGSLLEERMAGNLREQTAAFQAAEAAMQAALTAIEASKAPIGPGAWDSAKQMPIQGCLVSDRDDSSRCSFMIEALEDWRGSGEPSEGLPISHASLGQQSIDGVGHEPMVLVEDSYLPPLDFEKAVRGQGIHFYTVTALGVGPSGRSKRILQTTIAKVYAW